MKTTLIMYTLMGVLFLVPLILFNIRRFFVRKAPEPMKIHWGRVAFVVLFSAFIVVFLVTSCQTTLRTRYEITLEKIAEAHGQVLTGQTSAEDFRSFVIANGTDNVKASLDEADLTDLPVGSDEVRFQLGNSMNPRYWQDYSAFEQVDVIGDNNPIYLVYRMKAGGKTGHYTVRLRRVGDRWKYDWFGNATEEQVSIMTKQRYLSGEESGKWYPVEK